MRRLPAALLTAVALLVGACGGDDKDANPTTTPPASETPSGDSGATPPSGAQLPPQFIECMAAQGYAIESPDEIHSVPQQAFQACLGSLH